MACPTLDTNKDATSALVTSSAEQYSGMAQQWASQAISAAKYSSTWLGRQTLNVVPDTYTLSSSFTDTADPNALTGLPSFNIAAPTLDRTIPDNWNIGSVDAGEVPEFSESAPVFNAPTKPDALAITPPGEAPKVGDVFIPLPPDYELPGVPILQDITLPTADEITLPTWDEVAPDIDVPDPSGVFSWVEDVYGSELLDNITSRIQTMLAGGTGLPNAIWDMIWDRARAKLSEQRDAAIEEATERWAARGFSAPGGALNKQIDKAIALFDSLSAEQLRETAIKQADMEVKNIQFAVSQGIALESRLIQLFNEQAQRQFEAAKTVFGLAIDVYKAKISRYNVEAQLYATKAQVHKTLIDAELAKLQEYKLLLEGQKLVGELNLQNVQVYTARIDAVTKIIDIFRAELEGVKAQVTVDKTRVDAYVAEVTAYGEQVKAKGLEYEAYNSELKGEMTKAEVFKALTAAYSSRVDAYAKNVQAQSIGVETDIKVAQLDIEKYKAYLGKFDSEIKRESMEIDAVLKAYDAELNRYKAIVAEQGIKLDWAKLKVTADFDQKKLDTQEAIAQLQADVDIAKADAALGQEADKLTANVLSQLGASAMSTVNLSASLGFSGSASEGRSCSETFSSSVS